MVSSSKKENDKSKNKISELSVFFPLYNEEENLPTLIEEATKEIPKYAKKYEILLIDDGSTDKTPELARKFEKKYKHVRLVSQENKGYGGALNRGFEESKYKWVFFTDGDLQHKISDLKNFIEYIDDYDLIIGYREKRAEGFKRKFFTIGLKLWNKLFFNFPWEIKDVDCPFKLIRKNTLEQISPLESESGLISTELVLKSINNGMKVRQVSVSHKERQHGEEINRIPAIAKMMIDTFTKGSHFTAKKYNDETRKLLIASGALFLILLPLVVSIDYMQNDEYNYYLHVSNFLSGNFTLDPYMGATFYLQGFMGALFAMFFGISKIPILTLLVSVLNFYIFAKILNKFFNQDGLSAILVGLLLVLNPWYLYSIFGYMTENYFLLFLLLSIFYILEYEKTKAPIDFLLVNFFIFLGYLVRQLSFVTSLAFAIYFLVNGRFKAAAIQLIFLGLLLTFHFKAFPITPQMYDANLQYSNIENLRRTFSMSYIMLIYLMAFLAPLVVAHFFDKKNVKIKTLLITVLLAIPLFLYLNGEFQPGKIVFSARTIRGDYFFYNVKPDFPYLKNVFENRGFLTDDLQGTKYHFKGFFDLFRYWEIAAKFFVALFIITSLRYITRFRNFFLIFIILYGGLMLVTPRVIDRYLLPMVPVTILLLVYWKNEIGKVTKLAITGFLIFLFVLGYQYEMDYHLINKYVWNRSLQIHNELGVPKEDINPTHPWRSLYPTTRTEKLWDYIFKYDHVRDRPNDQPSWEVIEEKELKFPFSLYIEPKIYLYRRK